MSRAKNKKKELCQTKFCKNLRTLERRICNKCHSREVRAKNPVKDALRNLRHSATRRGIECKVSYEEFTQIAIDSGYISGKGRGKTKLSIDRIDPRKGYEAGNLRVLTVSENSKAIRRMEATAKVHGWDAAVSADSDPF